MLFVFNCATQFRNCVNRTLKKIPLSLSNVIMGVQKKLLHISERKMQKNMKMI